MTQSPGGLNSVVGHEIEQLRVPGEIVSQHGSTAPLPETTARAIVHLRVRLLFVSETPCDVLHHVVVSVGVSEPHGNRLDTHEKATHTLTDAPETDAAAGPLAAIFRTGMATFRACLRVFEEPFIRVVSTGIHRFYFKFIGVA